MQFSDKQAKVIMLIIADLVEYQIHIPVITKKIVNQCRELANSVNEGDKFIMQPKSDAKCLLSAKDWEIIKIQTETENFHEEVDENGQG